MFNLSEDSLGKNILLQPSIGKFISREKVAHILEEAGSFSCCHDGRNYEVHHNPLYQNKSYFVGHLVMIMDVTQYIQILGEKTKLIEQLEETNLVLKNTQNQLIQNEKLASIGQLAAGVAHEINNPTGFVLRNLGVLQEYVDVFKDLFHLYEKLLDNRKVVSSNREEIEADIRKLKETEDLDYILRDIGPLLQESTYGARRIRDIVQSLRDFSRTDQAGADYSNLNECIEQAIKISWNQLKYKCKVEKDLSAAPVMFFNKNKIEQVLVNILLNAADSIEGHGRIHITTDIEDQEVKVVVSDNGQGIRPEHIRRIFDPFFTTKEIGKGTGLGMYISHQIIKDHGGRIEVESRPDHGTRITIVLPIQGQLQNAKRVN